MPGAVNGIGARLHDVAEDRVIDPVRLHVRPRERRAARDRAQLDGGEIFQRARVFDHRRARAAQDKDVCVVDHCHQY
jgi:hypothetical protein